MPSSRQTPRPRPPTPRPPPRKRFGLVAAAAISVSLGALALCQREPAPPAPVSAPFAYPGESSSPAASVATRETLAAFREKHASKMEALRSGRFTLSKADVQEFLFSYPSFKPLFPAGPPAARVDSLYQAIAYGTGSRESVRAMLPQFMLGMDSLVAAACR